MQAVTDGSRPARRLFKKARLLTRPTPAATSPARPESAKTASSPRDAPFRGQGRSSAVDPRFTFHASCFTLLWNDARTKLGDCFNSLLVNVVWGRTSVQDGLNIL